MLIFNREEIENSFKTEDNEILQIESRLTLREFTQKFREGTLEEADYDLHVYRAGATRRSERIQTNEEVTDNSLYCHIFDPESENGLDMVEHRRAALYEEFERFTYGQNHDFIEVPRESIEDKDIYEDCLDALGILPTLYEEAPLRESADITIKQLQDLSYMGINLYRPWEEMNASNRIPTAKDLKLFHALSAYEKSVLLDSNLNPTKILDILHLLKEKPGQQDVVITKEFVEYLVNNHTTDNEVLIQFLSIDKPIYEAYKEQSDYKALEDAFQTAFNRPPRILPEIYHAYQCMFHGNAVAQEQWTPLTEEQIQQIVSEFNLNNVKKIAPLHNFALLLLSGRYNFDTIKKDHLQIFSTYMKPEFFSVYEQNGFFAWYEKYQTQIKTSDLHTLMRRDPTVTYFNLNLNPTQLLNLDSQIRGWCNAACVYEEYGIDFREAIVAIPNRGLVVEDKPSKIRMHILDSTDARIFTVGQDCRCCQNLAIAGDPTYGLSYRAGEITQELLEQHFTSIDEAYAYVAEHFSGRDYLITPGAGGSCVANELTNPFVWVTIWEDTVTGNTLAQADTHYIPETNTLVYDNIEFVNDGNAKKLYDIIAKYAAESTFDNVHIGVGYNAGMKDFGKRIATKEMAHYVEDVSEKFQEHFGTHVYSDYHSDAVKIKQGGEMLTYPKKPDSSFKIEHLPEDNTQFAYLLHPVSAMFSSYTYEQKQDLITRYEQQNLTVDEMIVIAKKNPKLLKDFEILPLQVQTVILYPPNTDRYGRECEPVLNMEGFQYIQNPDSLLITNALEQNPSTILYFKDSVMTRDHWLSVLQRDGSLIEYCPLVYRDEELLTIAIKNNPYSIKYVVNSLEGELRDKMIRLAVFKKPILAAHFPDLPEYVWIKICENKGQFGKFCPNQTYRVQQAMVNSSPYNIDYIVNPDPRIVEQVYQKIPSIASNPRYRTYFGQEEQPRERHRSNRIERSETPATEVVQQSTPSQSSYNLFEQEAEDFSLDDIA